MIEILIGNTSQLYEEVENENVYIYGAKTVAMRTERFLNFKGIDSKAFLVSNKYENPKELMGKTVLRIEEEKIHYECVIVAVSGANVWKVRDELLKYDIEKLLIIHPMMDDDFLSCRVILGRCIISDRAYIADNVQIVVDESSELIIESGVVINSGSVILVDNNSCLYINSQSVLGKNVFISVSNSSNINMKNMISIHGECRILVKNKSDYIMNEKVQLAKRVVVSLDNVSKLFMGNGCNIDELSRISGSNNSNIIIKDETYIGRNCVLGCYNNGLIEIGENTTIYDFLFMVSDKSCIIIGKECMFSYYIKINVGSHKIIEKNSKKEITNRRKIIIGNHVWCGMGVTILPGCSVGDGSIIGASSLVNKEVLNNVTCAGNPAVFRRGGIEWIR